MEFLSGPSSKPLINRYPEQEPVHRTWGPSEGGDGTRSAGASAWSAKISPADLHPGWKPPPELKAEVQPPFWQNLRPKPGDGQNPFEPLTSTFQARRDTMGSPTPGHDVGAMRGGWPAGGTYFKSTGSWGGE